MTSTSVVDGSLSLATLSSANGGATDPVVPAVTVKRWSATSLDTALGRSHASTVRYLPLRNAVSNEVALQRLTVTAGTTGSVALPFAELSVAKLSEPSTTEVDVIVVQRNKDLRKDLVEVLAALGRSGRLVAGVLLLD